MRYAKLLTLDLNNCLESVVGSAHGIKLSDISALQKRGNEIHSNIQERRTKDLGFYDVVSDRSVVTAVEAISKPALKKFDDFVLIGIGGSALGPAALYTALAHPHHNLLPRAKRKGMRLFVLDNSDPEMIARCLETVDLKKTLVNVISKSGTTAETMTGYMVAEQILGKKLGAKNVAKHLVYTTDPEKGILRALAGKTPSIPTLPIPDNIGGRFTVLAPVGLFPAACIGIDIRRLLKGAQWMAARCAKADILTNPAYLYAAIHHLLDTKKGKNIAVMMPYVQALRDIADWHRQLWAESLGKRFDNQGREVFVGQTPVKSLGATDQHSQVQLYVEGPNDKIHTFIRAESWRTKCPIPKGSLKGVGALDIFRGRDMADVITAELLATEFALASAQRPSIRLTMPTVSPETVGALLFMLELATAFAGGLYNINAFDQPGVEEGKRATYALMGRQTPDDEKKRKELAAYQKKRTVKPV